MTQNKETLEFGDIVEWKEGPCAYEGWVKKPDSYFPGEAEITVTRKDGKQVGTVAAVATFVKHGDISILAKYTDKEAVARHKDSRA